MLWQSLVVDNIGTLVTCDERRPDALGLVHDAVVLIDGDRITFAGARSELPDAIKDTRGVKRIDARGGVVTPGLIDCHTHVVFMGNRADEFARRARGETYQQIQAAGGGIRSTMQAVRAASEQDLVDATLPRLQAMLRHGVTTVESKSGYGLNTQDELKMLRAMRTLEQTQPISLVKTLLAAHVVPPEFAGRADEYVDAIINTLLPTVAKERLATACDVFVEGSAFSPAQGERLLQAAKQHGLSARVHAEQLSHCGGAQLAARVGALSAGHLEFVDEDDVTALVRAGVVCEVLATAQVFLRGQRPIDGALFKRAGATLAIGTDCNPGTAMSTNLPLAAALAVTQSGLSADDAIIALTRGGARACGLADRGCLVAGLRADVAVFPFLTPYDLVYRFGDVVAEHVVIGGKQVV